MVPQGISATSSRRSRLLARRLRQTRGRESARAGIALKEVASRRASCDLQRGRHARTRSRGVSAPRHDLESLAKLGVVRADVRHAAGGYAKTFAEYCRDVYPHVKKINHVHHAGNSSGVVDGAGRCHHLARLREGARTQAARTRRDDGDRGHGAVIMLTAPGPAAQRC